MSFHNLILCEHCNWFRALPIYINIVLKSWFCLLIALWLATWLLYAKHLNLTQNSDLWPWPWNVSKMEMWWQKRIPYRQTLTYNPVLSLVLESSKKLDVCCIGDPDRFGWKWDEIQLSEREAPQIPYQTNSRWSPMTKIKVEGLNSTVYCRGPL